MAPAWNCIYPHCIILRSSVFDLCSLFLFHFLQFFRVRAVVLFELPVSSQSPRSSVFFAAFVTLRGLFFFDDQLFSWLQCSFLGILTLMRKGKVSDGVVDSLVEWELLVRNLTFVRNLVFRVLLAKAKFFSRLRLLHCLEVGFIFFLEVE